MAYRVVVMHRPLLLRPQHRKLSTKIQCRHHSSAAAAPSFTPSMQQQQQRSQQPSREDPLSRQPAQPPPSGGARSGSAFAQTPASQQVPHVTTLGSYVKLYVPRPVPPSFKVSLQLAEELDNSIKMTIERFYAYDEKNQAPRAGRFVCWTLGWAVGLFGFAYLLIESPYKWDMIMNYHVKVCGLLLSLWGASYFGAEIARYGSRRSFFYGWPRLCIGVVPMAMGVGVLIGADYNPWKTYIATAGSALVVTGLDYLMVQTQSMPLWLFQYRGGVNAAIVATSLLAALKGPYIEEHAQDIIQSTSLVDLTTLDRLIELFRMPGWIMALVLGKEKMRARLKAERERRAEEAEIDDPRAFLGLPTYDPADKRVKAD
ncbi:unnamed protein product [Vitrella brassicaformis CCMP3155]|uniref:Uncharacterized protein n=2 Tax=Vitrella brassicaformis TaxID=1169539 RepID=A0A0G4EDJ4_VITBC|nr:unnamed protein product [Vitrella brassicaformis CCMP3155]|eukprot:CEL93787.1 unnamed protein product [Vitrella brassicaformis CCMP3155]